MKKYDFTVIGTAATVTVLKVKEMPQQGKSEAVLNNGLWEYENGGMGLNICAGLSKLGARVYPVLTYVDNRQKEYLYGFAEAHAMPVDGIMDPPGDSMGTTIMIQDQYKNHMTLITEYEKRMPDSTYFRPQKMEPHFFSDSRMIIFTAPMAMNTEPVLEAVRKSGVPLCVSMRRDPIALPAKLLKEFVQEAEIIFANEDETDFLKEIYRITDISELFGRGKLKFYVETLGGKGSRVYSCQNGRISMILADAVSGKAEEIETIGAGDGYVSGFMYGYINGFEPGICALYGSVVASFVIEKEGSITNLPTHGQMMERCKEVQGRKEV